MTTKPELKRFWFRIKTTDQWYAIMRECRQWFGNNWRTQPKVRRRLAPLGNQLLLRFGKPQEIWFDIPDERLATWVGIKLSIEVVSDSKRQANK